jgi:2-polyprenyl-6-methoxyphenol hydroxylase-like FAD-dependent oxidoreductase
VLEQFLERSVRVRRIRFYARGLVPLDTRTFSGIGCVHEYQCSLPQWQTEAILTEHLNGFGVFVERGTTVLSIEENADALDVRLRGPDGEIETASFRYVLGAGGAHSITRGSMHDSLSGDTYAGRYIAADISIGLPHDPEEAMIFAGHEGFVLLAPLPENHWITFVDLDPDSLDIDQKDTPELAQVSALLNRRIGVSAGVTDLRWASHFVMHKRISRRLADGHRFLMGDAAHLSSPIAGEGLNSALMDAADIAWKLALVVRGAALHTLLDAYEIERQLADRRVLEVSDMLHRRTLGLATAPAASPEPPSDPAHAVALARARAMLDISYAGSPLVGEHIGSATTPTASIPGPGPGERFPDRIRLTGTLHHLLLFGAISLPDAFRHRWQHLVSIAPGADFDLVSSGVYPDGALLVRPDGFIGYRLAQTDEGGITALDAHLASYLVPARA